MKTFAQILCVFLMLAPLANLDGILSADLTTAEGLGYVFGAFVLWEVVGIALFMWGRNKKKKEVQSAS